MTSARTDTVVHRAHDPAMPDEGVFKGYLRKTRARATGRSRRIRRSCASVWEVGRDRLGRHRSRVGFDRGCAPPPQSGTVGRPHSGSASRPVYRHCCDGVRSAVHPASGLELPARSRLAPRGRARDHDRHWQPARPEASLRNGQPRAAPGRTHAAQRRQKGNAHGYAECPNRWRQENSCGLIILPKRQFQ